MKPNYPSMKYKGETFYEIGCVKCRKYPTAWSLFADLRIKKILGKCQICGHISHVTNIKEISK